ncbi:hypothetical protein HMPREF9962_1262 [Streptococcus parasanguinis SK236]|jgi:hypothetical protein|nr:hypothetical protein HMPREF9962_1262 [Streptococcus parasanguinis SK236]
MINVTTFEMAKETGRIVMGNKLLMPGMPFGQVSSVSLVDLKE